MLEALPRHAYALPRRVGFLGRPSTPAELAVFRRYELLYPGFEVEAWTPEAMARLLNATAFTKPDLLYRAGGIVGDYRYVPHAPFSSWLPPDRLSSVGDLFLAGPRGVNFSSEDRWEMPCAVFDPGADFWRCGWRGPCALGGRA